MRHSEGKWGGIDVCVFGNVTTNEKEKKGKLINEIINDVLMMGDK
jgi:hypothetical protein